MTPRPTPRQRERQAREKVESAISLYQLVASQSQWKNGYRCGSGRGDDDVLYREELRLWTEAESRYDEVQKALTAYARAIRASAKEK